ncbi:MAG TPA: c-type cytochrome [Bryobacteraceae bacterium]|jgi:mono/diheme cytochrome c family protein|nr:c-type cytochrome [Bryobacteraceae bacterium]
MFECFRKALPALLLLAPSALLNAQEPATAGAGSKASNDKSVTAAAVAASKEDPAAFARGATAYVTYCAGCHGATARGGPGAPDLVRSLVVLDDEKGILISPILRNGKPDAGMPKLGLSEAQISDLVAWLHVQTYAAGHRNTYAFQDVLTGDPKKGAAYFQTTCSGCHSATGDLKGIGARYDGFALQARWLQPRGGRGAGGGGGGRGGRGGANAATAAPNNRGTTTVTVTLPSGQKFSGPLDRVDDFSVSLRDSAGEYRSFTREGATPKVEINDPLKPHVDLLSKYTDADIHNITAYLVTLK